MKKGFTLIELLAVIIILAIIALIATPIVLDVVDDAKDSAARSEAAMVVSGVNNYCAAAAMQVQLGVANTDCDNVAENIAKMVDLGNAELIDIDYSESKVQSLKLRSNGRVVSYDVTKPVKYTFSK